LYVAEPTKQFALVEQHIAKIQQVYEFQHSEIVVMVERNLCVHPCYVFKPLLAIMQRQNTTPSLPNRRRALACVGQH
jgi:hypothetical protein